MSLFDKLDKYAEQARQILIDKYKGKQIQPNKTSKAVEGVAYWQGYDSNGRGQVKQGGKIVTVNTIGNINIPVGTAVYVDSTGTIEIKKKKKVSQPPKFEPKKPKRTYPSVNREILTDEGEARINPVYILTQEYGFAIATTEEEIIYNVEDPTEQFTWTYGVAASDVGTDRTIQVYTGKDGLLVEFNPWDYNPPSIVGDEDCGLLAAVSNAGCNDYSLGYSNFKSSVGVRSYPYINQVIDNYLYITLIRASYAFGAAFALYQWCPTIGGVVSCQDSYQIVEYNPPMRSNVDIVTFAINLDSGDITSIAQDLYSSSLNVNSVESGFLFNCSEFDFTHTVNIAGIREAFKNTLPDFHPFKNCVYDDFIDPPSAAYPTGQTVVTEGNYLNFPGNSGIYSPSPYSLWIPPGSWITDFTDGFPGSNGWNSFKIYMRGYNTTTGERVTNPRCISDDVAVPGEVIIYELARLDGYIANCINFKDLVRWASNGFAAYIGPGSLADKAELINLDGWTDEDKSSYLAQTSTYAGVIANTGNCFGTAYGDYDPTARVLVDQVYFTDSGSVLPSFAVGQDEVDVHYQITS